MFLESVKYKAWSVVGVLLTYDCAGLLIACKVDTLYMMPVQYSVILLICDHDL